MYMYVYQYEIKHVFFHRSRAKYPTKKYILHSSVSPEDHLDPDINLIIALLLVDPGGERAGVEVETIRQIILLYTMR